MIPKDDETRRALEAAMCRNILFSHLEVCFYFTIFFYAFETYSSNSTFYLSVEKDLEIHLDIISEGCISDLLRKKHFGASLCFKAMRIDFH